ncbi:MAG: signal peptide peptidase SppA, partial [Myxococcota bacterium]
MSDPSFVEQGAQAAGQGAQAVGQGAQASSSDARETQKSTVHVSSPLSGEGGPPFGSGPVYVMQQPPQRRSWGCFTWVAIALLVSVLVNIVLWGQMSSKRSAQTAKKLQEMRLSGKGNQKVIVINLSGVITEGQGSFRERATAAAILPRIRRAEKDNTVKGILLLANSPGGSVTASDKIFHALKRFGKKKKIVAIMGDTCASGCVYVTAAAHKIYAHPTTVTGSIGVIVSTLNFAEMLKKIGVKGVNITSKENKALLSPFAPVQEEHKKIIKVIVDQMYQRFVKIVAEGRKLPPEKVFEVADGRVFTAKDALRYKLVDN